MSRVDFNYDRWLLETPRARHAPDEGECHGCGDDCDTMASTHDCGHGCELCRYCRECWDNWHDGKSPRCQDCQKPITWTAHLPLCAWCRVVARDHAELELHPDLRHAR